MASCVVRLLPFCLWTIFWPTGDVDCFSQGAPDNSCKDPSTFHTRKINSTHEGIILPQDVSTNPYRLSVVSNFFSPGQEISVTLGTTDPNIPLQGFFIQAVQADIDIRDLKRQAFGEFKNSSSRERPSPCQSVNNIQRGGITHTDAKPKQNVTVNWIAPTDYNPGNIQFLATGVEKYDIYWTDVRSDTLVPKNYEQLEGNGKAAEALSPTALWYRWLQFLRHQQSHTNHTQGHTSSVTS